MTAPRAIAAIVVAAMVGCRDEPPAPTSAPQTISAAKAAEAAHGGPLPPTDDPPPPGRAASGSIEAKLDGKPFTFTFLSYGRNALIDLPERGVARVTLAGAVEQSGFPSLRIALEHLRLDGLALPVELPGPGGGTSPVQVDMRYEPDNRRTWHNRPDAPEAERARVRIESFDGTTVVGSFSATLQPKAKSFGPPIRVEDGRFSVTLRRHDAKAGITSSPPRP
jgi:hypothetical protein